MGLLSFGKSPLDGTPKKVGKGLLKPVVLRNIGARTPSDRPGEEMLEGGGIGRRGGGGSRSFGSHGTARPDPARPGWEITSMPGRGEVSVKVAPETKGWTPRFVNLSVRSPGSRGPHEYQAVTVDTPSGQTVSFVGVGRGETSVNFFPTSHAHGRVPQATGQDTFQHTANTFGHVVKSVDAYVKMFKPKMLRFYGASTRHDRLYDKAAPQLAERLGGTHRQSGRYHYIDLPGSDY